MSSVQAELKFAEQKLRHQMQEELELQLHFQERRCSDKVSFMRAKADAHVAHVRKASYTKAQSDIAKTRREERAARELLTTEEVSSAETRHAEEIYQLNELQRQYIVRMQELQVENKNLHARIRTHDESVLLKDSEMRRLQHRDVQVISALEQQLTAKDQEIQMLREQLSAVKIVPQSQPLSAPVAPPALPSGLTGLAGAVHLAVPTLRDGGAAAIPAADRDSATADAERRALLERGQSPEVGRDQPQLALS
jgi:hypothetical protein